MADGILVLNPGVGGDNEDVETLLGAGGATVIRQRVQMAGAILAEIARVQATDPAGVEMALVTRNIPQRTANAPGISRVAANAASVPVLAANALRKQACFYNQTATGKLYLLLGNAGAAIGGPFTVVLLPGGYYELPQPVYTGEIDGIWDVADGAVQVTEIT